MPISMDLGLVAVTIANGTALSAKTSIGPETLCGIIMPAGWTAAGLSIQGSPDDGATFYELCNTSGLLAFTVLASQWLVLDPVLFRGVFCVKVRSGSLASPVNQGADRILQLVTRALP